MVILFFIVYTFNAKGAASPWELIQRYQAVAIPRKDYFTTSRLLRKLAVKVAKKECRSILQDAVRVLLNVMLCFEIYGYPFPYYYFLKGRTSLKRTRICQGFE